MLVLGSNHSNHSSLQWLSVCFIIDFQIFPITFKTFDLFANYSRNVAQMSLYVVKKCWFSSNVCKNIFLKSSFLFFYCDLLGFTHLGIDFSLFLLQPLYCFCFSDSVYIVIWGFTVQLKTLGCVTASTFYQNGTEILFRHTASIVS